MNRKMNKIRVYTLAIAVVVFLFYVYFNQNEHKEAISHPWTKVLSIFKNTRVCTDLLNDFDTYEMSSTFQHLFLNMKAEAKKVEESDGEGHSAEMRSELVVLHHIARQPWVKVICETGFNYGHSSFNFLAANPSAHVYSFDLGAHGYASKMNKSLHGFFPDNRLHLTFGNSVKTIPEAIASGILPPCDVVFVDGGHTYPVAKADIDNLAMHTNVKNFIILDDYPTSWGGGFGRAWEEVMVGSTLLEGEEIDFKQIKSDILNKKNKDNNILERKFGIKEMMRCTSIHGETTSLSRGFVVGTVVKVS